MLEAFFALGVTGDPHGAVVEYLRLSFISNYRVTVAKRLLSLFSLIQCVLQSTLVNMTSNEDYSSSTSSDGAILQRPSKNFRVLSESEESSSSSSSDMMRASTIRRRRIESDSETETEDSDNNEDDVPEEFDVNWRIPLGNKTNITFSDSSGTNTNQSEIFACTEPHDFYFLFVTEEIFEIIAKQTNIYATQRKSELQSYRLDQWYETNANEIKRFFGLIIWMGLVRLPKIELYWSTYEGYKQALPRTIMSRNRFELLLRFVHFSNNEENDPNNRLSKVAHIIDHLNSNFKKYYNPDEVVCVDESLVPFRGRILFRQYIKQKRHRYGIKVLNYVVGQDILGKGHTICTDNWYTSVNLAEKLIDMHTHLLGTLRKNRRDNPKEVVAQKLKRGDVIARENKNGVTVLKWKDKRDVLMLSTKHSAEMTTIQKRNCTKEKPRMVVEYNLGKSSVDLSDQMVAYCSPLRKTIKCNNGIIEKCISINIYTNYVLLSFAASPVTGGPHGAVAKSSAGHR
ncbi:piggyBac transposable element-derived protein 4-like, partial [Cataglyphis hispanica]|uniref:piggyBac transposable element-derived protein 4-like n=1 Tax=Cataglyphis hispanica TaxID=1086592 RepID=UPI00217FD5EF